MTDVTPREFLEILTDPLRFGVRKAVFELYNRDNNHLIIYDLRIQQVNELPYYHIILKVDNREKMRWLHDEMLDVLAEHIPASATVTSDDAKVPSSGKFERVFYVYDRSLNGHGEQHFNL